MNCQANLNSVAEVGKRLIAAAVKGDTLVMRWALTAGATPLAIGSALLSAAKYGHIAAMQLAREHGARDVDAALSAAAEGGHVECMKCALRWDATDVDAALGSAAQGGSRRCMELAHSWGASAVDNAMALAAYGGHLECMALARSWGATDVNEALVCAALGGRAACVRAAIEWGATNINAAAVAMAENGHGLCLGVLVEVATMLAGKVSGVVPEPIVWDEVMDAAAGAGHDDILAYARDHGAGNFNAAFRSAALYGRATCLALLKKWGASDFDGALREAACGGELDAMRQLRTWGATDVNGALRAAAFHGDVRGMALAREWGATDYAAALAEAARDDSSVSDTISALGTLDGWLREAGTSVAARTRAYNDTLIAAAKSANTRAIEWAFARGADAYEEARTAASRSSAIVMELIVAKIAAKNAPAPRGGRRRRPPAIV